MARQNISIGSAANDGTGDSLRSGGQKLNQNFVELYLHLGGDSDALPGHSTITADGTLDLSFRYYILNKASALALTLSSGQYVGQEKIFTNKGAGTATITANLAGASVSFALAQNEGCQVIWDGTEWFLIGNQSIVTLA
jgi:hypothetical protein